MDIADQLGLVLSLPYIETLTSICTHPLPYGGMVCTLRNGTDRYAIDKSKARLVP